VLWDDIANATPVKWIDISHEMRKVTSFVELDKYSEYCIGSDRRRS